MSDRYYRKYRRDALRSQCAELGIAIPEKARLKQLESALDTYYKDAAIVHIGDELDLRQTDKPTAEYTVHFTIYIAHSVRAESKEAALRWMEEHAADYYDPDIGYLADSGEYNFIAVDTEDDLC